jgi:hypothetical protein
MNAKTRVIIFLFIFYLFIHYLQLGRHAVAGVVTCYISTDYEDMEIGCSNWEYFWGDRREKLPCEFVGWLQGKIKMSSVHTYQYW